MGWQLIETAPRDGSDVLLLGKKVIANGYWLASAYNGNGAWIWPYIYKTPTHWIQIPKPPTRIK